MKCHIHAEPMTLEELKEAIDKAYQILPPNTPIGINIHVNEEISYNATSLYSVSETDFVDEGKGMLILSIRRNVDNKWLEKMSTNSDKKTIYFSKE